MTLTLLRGRFPGEEIGASLKITEGTVKVHISHVLKKLGAGGRADAIRIALERGIVHMA